MMEKDDSNKKNPQSKFKTFIGICIVIFVLGLFFWFLIMPFITGAINFVDRGYITSTGKYSTATVVGYQPISHTQRNGNVFYTYIPELKLSVDGSDILVKSDFNEVNSQALLPVGSTTDVVYSPSNPLKCIITNSEVSNNSIYPYLSIGLFVAFFTISKFISHRLDKRYKKSLKTKGLVKYFVISLILLSCFIAFIIWEFTTGVVFSSDNLMSTVLFIIFILIQIRLLKEIVGLYIRNNARSYLS